MGSYVSVRIDLDDVFDEIDDDDLLEEVENRNLSAKVAKAAKVAVSDPNEDVDYLRRCIRDRDWAGATIYLDRLFPQSRVDPAAVAKAYAQWAGQRDLVPTGVVR